MLDSLTRNAVLSILLLITVACHSSSPESEAGSGTPKRAHNSHARVIELSVPRKEFMTAARNVDQIRRLRLIEVTASDTGGRSASPEYRLFNIQPQSAYALLGLQEGDVLVSANDYALADPEVFRQYVQVLHVEAGDTFVEIRRGGQEIVLNFTFVP